MAQEGDTACWLVKIFLPKSSRPGRTKAGMEGAVRRLFPGVFHMAGKKLAAKDSKLAQVHRCCQG